MSQAPVVQGKSCRLQIQRMLVRIPPVHVLQFAKSWRAICGNKCICILFYLFYLKMVSVYEVKEHLPLNIEHFQLYNISFSTIFAKFHRKRNLKHINLYLSKLNLTHNGLPSFLVVCKHLCKVPRRESCSILSVQVLISKTPHQRYIMYLFRLPALCLGGRSLPMLADREHWGGGGVKQFPRNLTFNTNLNPNVKFAFYFDSSFSHG